MMLGKCNSLSCSTRCLQTYEPLGRHFALPLLVMLLLQCPMDGAVTDSIRILRQAGLERPSEPLLPLGKPHGRFERALSDFTIPVAASLNQRNTEHVLRQPTTLIDLAQPLVLCVPNPVGKVTPLGCKNSRVIEKGRNLIRLSLYPKMWRSTKPLMEEAPNSLAKSEGSSTVRLPKTLSVTKHVSTPFLSAAPPLS